MQWPWSGVSVSQVCLAPGSPKTQAEWSAGGFCDWCAPERHTLRATECRGGVEGVFIWEHLFSASLFKTAYIFLPISMLNKESGAAGKGQQSLLLREGRCTGVWLTDSLKVHFREINEFHFTWNEWNGEICCIDKKGGWPIYSQIVKVYSEMAQFTSVLCAKFTWSSRSQKPGAELQFPLPCLLQGHGCRSQSG